MVLFPLDYSYMWMPFSVLYLLFDLQWSILWKEIVDCDALRLAGVGNITPENDAIRVRRLMIGCMRSSFGNSSTSQLRSLLSLIDRMES